MPRSGPEGVDLPEIFPFHSGKTPADDRACFEMLSVCVRRGPELARAQGEAADFVRAFDGFDIAKVAAYGERDIDRLLATARSSATARRSTARSRTPAPCRRSPTSTAR
jgi:hypothetical protein